MDNIEREQQKRGAEKDKRKGWNQVRGSRMSISTIPGSQDGQAYDDHEERPVGEYGPAQKTLDEKQNSGEQKRGTREEPRGSQSPGSAQVQYQTTGCGYAHRP